MRTLALLPVACVSLIVAAAPQAVSAMPGLGQAAGHASDTAVTKIEFLRRPDGSVWYKHPDPNSQGPYLFYYRGYAYRQARGELRPSDRPHRLKVVE